MKNKKYFERQIKGLILILKDCDYDNELIARSYVIEKLNMMLNNGIGFHPTIINALEVKK